MINLDEVLTFREAAEKWGLADGNTIRKAVMSQVMIIESEQHPERILCILKNQEELANWKKRLQVYFL